MKKFIKLLLLVVVVGFALINYRIFSFDKGFSKSQMDEDASLSQVLNTITGIKKVEYYKKTIGSNDYEYKVFISTNVDNFLFDATKEDIDGFDLMGIFSSNLKPEKISPIPFYVEIIVGVIILCIPTERKEKSKK